MAAATTGGLYLGSPDQENYFSGATTNFALENGEDRNQIRELQLKVHKRLKSEADIPMADTFK